MYDPLAALAPDAPRVHDTGNLLRSWHLRSGDIGQGFARADVVVEQTYRTPFVDHAYLETETGIGWIDAEGVLVLRVSTQVLEHYRDVAEILQLPHGRVRLEGAYLGGGFGGKEDVTVECLLGLLVWKTRRPVQLVFSREESFIGHGKRHPYVMRYRTRRHARRHAHRARGRADLRLGRLRGALAVGPALQPGDRDRALSDPAREGRRDDRLHQQPRRQRLSMLRLDPDLPGLRGPDGRARRRARHGSARAAREELSAQGRRARHRAGPRDGSDAGRDDAPGVGRSRRAPRHHVRRRESDAASPPRSRPTAACAGRATRPAPGSAWSSTAPPSSAAPRPTSAAARPRRSARSPPRCSASTLEQVTAVGPRQPLHAARRHDHGHAPAPDVGQRRAQRGARAAPSSGRRRGRPAGGRAGRHRAGRRAGARPGRAGPRGHPGQCRAGRDRRGPARPGAREVRRAVGADDRSRRRARARRSTTTRSARTPSRSRSTTRPAARA